MYKKSVFNYADAAITALCIAILFYLMIKLMPIILTITAIGAIVINHEKFKRYAKNVWLGLDNFFSSMLGGHWEDTLSSRLGKAQEDNSTVLGFIANRVDNLWYVTLNQVGHCKNAIELRNNKHQVTGR